MASGSVQDSVVEGPSIAMRLTLAGIRQKFPSVKNLSTESLASLMKTNQTTSTSPETDLKDKLLLLDAREEEEYVVGHIPGARRVDYEAGSDGLLSVVPELQSLDSNITVICYCSVGYRSSVVAKKISSIINKQDIENKEAVKVYNLEGSIFKWANENRPMVDGKDRATVYTHPYNAVFGKLLRKELRRTDVES